MQVRSRYSRTDIAAVRPRTTWRTPVALRTSSCSSPTRWPSLGNRGGLSARPAAGRVPPKLGCGVGRRFRTSSGLDSYIPTRPDMKRLATLLLLLFAPALRAQTFDPFARGDAIALDKAIPANERGILCLAIDDRGRVYGGTTGRAAHLFVHDPATGSVRSLARLPGGVGFAHALLRLPDGSLLGGTQADPTGIAVQTDPKAVGHLYRFIPNGDGPAKVEDLGVPVQGQGICTLAYLEKSSEVVGNTWPDGHFFTYDLKAKKFRDHGAIAGYRTFEQPRHAEDINRGGGRQVRYPRQVSRAIAVDPATGAYTGGADG